MADFLDTFGDSMPLMCTQNCTTIVSEVAAWFGKDHASLEAEAAGVHVGCDGVTMLPFLTGERAPALPHATAGVVGLRPGAIGGWGGGQGHAFGQEIVRLLTIVSC